QQSSHTHPDAAGGAVGGTTAGTSVSAAKERFGNEPAHFAVDRAAVAASRPHFFASSAFSLTLFEGGSRSRSDARPEPVFPVVIKSSSSSAAVRAASVRMRSSRLVVRAGRLTVCTQRVFACTRLLFARN